MPKFKILLDKETCIGCGACTVACKNFVSDGDKAKVVESEVEEIGCNKEGIDACPIHCITITEIEEEKTE